MKKLILIFAAVLLLTSCAKTPDGNIYRGEWEGTDAEIAIENNTAIFSYSLSENIAGTEVKESLKATGAVEKREKGVYYACFNDVNARIKAKITVTGEGAEEYLQNLEKTLLLIVNTDADKALAKAYCSGKEITFGIESDLYELIPEIPEEFEFTLDGKNGTFEIIITETEE